jgi:hypothetical protein
MSPSCWQAEGEGQMNAERLLELEEIAAKLLALARELPPGEERDKAFQQIGSFQIRIDMLKDAVPRGLKAKGQGLK